MNVALVMEEMGSKLETIEDLNVKPFSAEDVTPPMASVSLPREPVSRQDYSARFAVFDVLILVTANDSENGRDLLGAYGSDKDPKSISLALDSSGANTYVHCKEVTVTSIVYDPVNIQGVDYLALLARVEADGNDEE